MRYKSLIKGLTASVAMYALLNAVSPAYAGGNCELLRKRSNEKWRGISVELSNIVNEKEPRKPSKIEDDRFLNNVDWLAATLQLARVSNCNMEEFPFYKKKN